MYRHKPWKHEDALARGEGGPSYCVREQLKMVAGVEHVMNDWTRDIAALFVIAGTHINAYIVMVRGQAGFAKMVKVMGDAARSKFPQAITHHCYDEEH